MENSLPDVVYLAAGDDMLKNNSIDCETRNAAESLNVVKKQPYVCDKCDRAYSVKRELVTHQRVHQGRPTYQCFQCEKEFGTRQLLRKHELWHTGKRSHICTQCGKAFFQKGHLTQHLMIHNGGRPHVCLVCTKTFIFKFDLNRHMKIHQTAASRHSHKKCTEKARPNKRSSANERQNDTANGATASSPTNLCSSTAVIQFSQAPILTAQFPFACVLCNQYRQLLVNCQRRIDELEKQLQERHAHVHKLNTKLDRSNRLVDMIIESCRSFDQLWIDHTKNIVGQLHCLLSNMK
ncbi:Zinc finger protein [Trichinella zimbabwensis]|uniref:Zinc finger protein n=1 Tax=Trichinella zimbabwensis TaxID=268475 RepID=A0A0V1HGI3_9BILA|nr:Zinc finger protein [Trichinella zimbabwensis]